MKLFGITALLFCLLLSINTQAQSSRGKEKGKGKKEGFIQTLPGITDAQKLKIKDIKKKYKGINKPIKGENKSLREQLNSLLQTESPNLTEVNSLVDKIHTNKASIRKNKIAKVQEIRKELTPEQRKLYDEHLKQKANERKNKMNKAED